MKRRSAIKNLMIFAGGIYLLPSCAGDGKSSIELKNLDILVGEEALLGEVAEAMIPKNNQPFHQLDAIARTHFIESTLKDTNSDPALRTFFEITKRRVIQGFTNSKYVMTDLKQYEMVPGRYNGYFPVEKV